MVSAGARRIDELRAADRRPAVHQHDDRRRRFAARELLVDQLEEARTERVAIAPHVELPGEALDLVDDRVATVALVVPGR